MDHEWVNGLFKKISNQQTKFYMLGSGTKDCVQVYHDVNSKSLILLNLAKDNNFGGFGFRSITTDVQTEDFAIMLIKLSAKVGVQNVENLKIIGCDVGSEFAQNMADCCNFDVFTLPNLHNEYPEKEYGTGHSRLPTGESSDYFHYGYVFDNIPASKMSIIQQSHSCQQYHDQNGQFFTHYVSNRYGYYGPTSQLIGLCTERYTPNTMSDFFFKFHVEDHPRLPNN